VCDADPPISADIGQSKAQETIACLTKDAVREGKNKREGESPDGQGSIGGYSGGYSSGRQAGSEGYGGGSTQQSKSCDLLLMVRWYETDRFAGRNQESRSGYGGSRFFVWVPVAPVLTG